ncbi:hypothetical protein SUDANB19_00909 [Streptomyces sp. enrichment culture]
MRPPATTPSPGAPKPPPAATTPSPAAARLRPSGPQPGPAGRTRPQELEHV